MANKTKDTGKYMHRV